MKTENCKTESVQINSTCEAVVISPNLTARMALVDLQTLKRITSMLSEANFGDIKMQFVQELASTQNLEQYTEAMRAELLFHESVNLIKTIEF